MADRLETYDNLINTYRKEIGTLDSQIMIERDNIDALTMQLDNARRRLEHHQVNRADQIDQLRGIRDVVTKMKISQLVRNNAAEDYTLD